MTLRLACCVAGPQTVEHARLAESLGYNRVWLADSPALWQDIWARMALVAEHTHRIQLGTAVLIPSLRHVVTQAAAIATIADIAPGRLTVGLATGFTGRAALGSTNGYPGPLSNATSSSCGPLARRAGGGRRRCASSPRRGSCPSGPSPCPFSLRRQAREVPSGP